MEFTFLLPEDLKTAAETAQEYARRRRATPEDCFLATPVSETSEGAAVVRPLSSSQIRELDRAFLSQARGNRHLEQSERLITAVLSAQHPDAVTAVQHPVNMLDTFPGHVPLIDHLRVRASSELGWDLVVGGIDAASAHRIPTLAESACFDEIVVGHTSSDRILRIIDKLKRFKRKICEQFHICLLAGDSESAAIPPATLANFKVSKAPTVFKRPDPWVAGVSKTNMPVRFMIGHLGWAIHVRINLEAMTDSDPNTLTLAACTLQPELQTLIDEAGTLVGVGICEDISKFNDVLQMISGERLRFYDPVDAAVLARLAGINTPKHSVQNLVWLCLGGYLPKDRASVGDNKWHLPTSAVPNNLRQYLRGDTTQLALAVWVLIVCWVMHVFPDLHAVFKTSVAITAGDLIRWWVRRIIDERVIELRSAPAWSPATTREEAVRSLGFSEALEDFFCHLTPRWPSIAAGGARFFHDCRAWHASRMDTLLAVDPRFWLRSYREEVHILRLGRILPADSPSSTAVRWHQLAPNPEFDDILTLPAAMVTKAAFNRLVTPGRPKRVILIEYALTNPDEAVNLLLRLESSGKFAARLFVTRPKIVTFINELRQFLGYFGLLPARPEGWVDRYPPQQQADRLQRSERIAQSLIDASARRIRRLEARKAEFERALAECRGASRPDQTRHAALDRFLQRPELPRNINDPDAFRHMGRRAPKRSASGTRRPQQRPTDTIRAEAGQSAAQPAPGDPVSQPRESSVASRFSVDHNVLEVTVEDEPAAGPSRSRSPSTEPERAARSKRRRRSTSSRRTRSSSSDSTSSTSSTSSASSSSSASSADSRFTISDLPPKVVRWLLNKRLKPEIEQLKRKKEREERRSRHRDRK
jgi:hypothetical protein